MALYNCFGFDKLCNNKKEKNKAIMYNWSSAIELTLDQPRESIALDLSAN